MLCRCFQTLLAGTTNNYSCRYEVRVVAISSAGQAAVERAVYTLTAGKIITLLSQIVIVFLTM